MKPAVTLVTGASRGIGRAIALEAASRGHDVIVVYHQERKQAEAVCAAAEAAGSTCARAYPCDVSEPEAVSDLFSRVRSELGPITNLVNCAGYVGDRWTLAEMPV